METMLFQLNSDGADALEKRTFIPEQQHRFATQDKETFFKQPDFFLVSIVCHVRCSVTV